MRLEEILDELYESVSPNLLAELAEALENADLSPEEASRIVPKLLEALDGIRDVLLRLYAVDLGRRVAEAALEFLSRYRGDEFRVAEAYVLAFLGDLSENRTAHLERARRILRGLSARDEFYAYVLSRVGVALANYYDVHGRPEAAEIARELVYLLLESDKSLVRGDANLLVFASVFVDRVPKGPLRALLEELGFVRDGRLEVPSFVAAAFAKNISRLARALGLKFP